MRTPPRGASRYGIWQRHLGPNAHLLLPRGGRESWNGGDSGADSFIPSREVKEVDSWWRFHYRKLRWVKNEGRASEGRCPAVVRLVMCRRAGSAHIRLITRHAQATRTRATASSVCTRRFGVARSVTGHVARC